MQLRQFVNKTLSSLEEMMLYPRHFDAEKCLVTEGGDILFCCFDKAVACPRFLTESESIPCFKLDGK